MSFNGCTHSESLSTVTETGSLHDDTGFLFLMDLFSGDVFFVSNTFFSGVGRLSATVVSSNSVTGNTEKTGVFFF